MTPSDANPLGFAPIDHAAPDVDDVPRRTHPRTILANLFTTLVAGFYLGVRFLSEFNRPSSTKSSNVPLGWVLAGVSVVVIGHFSVELLRWRAFTFRVNRHRLVIDKGILTRHHIVIPFDRVQQVDVNRRLIAIILGLAAVRIDTAGMGDHTSVQLRYLGPQEANGLRAFILEHRDTRADGPGDARDHDESSGAASVKAAPTEDTLLVLGPQQLVVAALTHHSVLIALPMLIGAGLWAMALASVTSRGPVGVATFGLGAAAFVGIFVLTVIRTIFDTVVRQWGFTLSHAGSDLHLRFGLTDQRHLTVPRRRIQHVEVIDNPVRRALGLVSVHLHSAASVTGAGEGQAATRFEIPVLPRRELATVLPLVVGDPYFHVPVLTPRPAAARRRAILRRAALVVVAVSAPAIVLRPIGPLLFGAVAVAIPWGLAAHRRAGHASTPTTAVLAHGVLHHRVILVPINRVQSARTSSSPFQRRLDLETVHLDVARTVQAPQLFDMDATAADHLRRSCPAQTTPPADPYAVSAPPITTPADGGRVPGG